MIYNPRVKGLSPLHPASVDLTEWASPVENQSQLGSCTAQAIVGAYELLLNKNYPGQFVDLSRLFVYYNARLFDNYIFEDVGAYIHDGINAVAAYGICSESIWPYNIEKFTVQPATEAYADAKTRTFKSYNRVHNTPDIIQALNQNQPVVIGVYLFEDFNKLSATNPILSMPQSTEKTKGGHAMCITGYSLDNRLFKVRNSFGTDWGDNGYCYIPFDYAKEYFDDCWTFDIKLNP